ncbi:MAG: autoinducer binding domain-containing protein, partial [Massilia sp.]
RPMEPWKEEGMHALLQHPAEHEFFSYCAANAKAIGFDFCSFGIALPVPISNPTIIILNDYPEDWWTRYETENYVSVDPTIRHAVTSTDRLLWSSEAFASAPEMWEDVKAHGLHHGWGQPTRDDNGAKGMLTIARGAGAICDAELTANAERMNYVAQMTMAGLTNLVVSKVIPESNSRLTPREKEVLRWAADGKTSYEIGRILTISNSAVNFHIKNSMIKLNANNKTHAVVKAALLGLLY